MYRCFVSVSQDTRDPFTDTDEFYHYCVKLSDVLMNINFRDNEDAEGEGEGGTDRLREVSEILCMVNKRFELNYYLMAECLLRSLLKLYGRKIDNRRQGEGEEIIQDIGEETRAQNSARAPNPIQNPTLNQRHNRHYSTASMSSKQLKQKKQ